MRPENWQEEIVDATEASADLAITWELLINHIEQVRQDIRMLRLEIEKLEAAFGAT